MITKYNISWWNLENLFDIENKAVLMVDVFLKQLWGVGKIRGCKIYGFENFIVSDKRAKIVVIFTGMYTKG
jgi:hypothetical protein